MVSLFRKVGGKDGRYTDPQSQTAVPKVDSDLQNTCFSLYSIATTWMSDGRINYSRQLYFCIMAGQIVFDQCMVKTRFDHFTYYEDTDQKIAPASFATNVVSFRREPRWNVGKIGLSGPLSLC